jgi:Tfp pilus assembly protein PilP
MMSARKIYSLLVLATLSLGTSRLLWAQDTEPTPSQKTKEAVEKFNKAPATIGKSLQGLRDAAKDKLQQVLGAKRRADAKPEQVDLDLPKKTAVVTAATPPLKPSARDPFRPMTMRTKVNTRSRENLSPLERLDLTQLKVVGVVWDIKEPRAMVEDSTGLGYVVKVGTPIGNNGGTVKVIRRNQIVIEESFDDIYGVHKKHDVSMNLQGEP